MKRVLKPDGFIVLLGVELHSTDGIICFQSWALFFKEEIVWDKSHCTSPLMSISRVHETVSIHTKKMEQ